MAFRNRDAISKSPAISQVAKAAGDPVAMFQPSFIPSYQAPGHLDDLDTNELRSAWNRVIASEYEDGDFDPLRSRFFSLDFQGIPGGLDADSVRWTADPAEPNFCFEPETARKLSDWALDAGHPVHSALSVRGRRETHNEYCEYKIVYSVDADKKLRPKRVIFTTELREYWVMLATVSPSRLKHAADQVTGRSVSWSELYGPGVDAPEQLTAEEREVLFTTWVSGAAAKEKLLEKGVPAQPIGTLNNQEALFMTHGINGLDDLLYIVLYGAHPFARKQDGVWIPATKDEIFSKSHFGETNPPIQLACRHADPGAATGAAAQAFEGKTVGFADPLGMYIQSFADKDFLFAGKEVPAEWINFSRGSGKKFYQRLVFGPPDDSPHFLDEITVGDDHQKVTGGFQIAQRIEVGPWVRIGDPSVVTEEEFKLHEVAPLEPPHSCALAGVCRRLRRLRDEYKEITKEP